MNWVELAGKLWSAVKPAVKIPVTTTLIQPVEPIKETNMATGWSEGSQLAKRVWTVVKPKLPATAVKAVAEQIIVAFEAKGCTTMKDATQLWTDAGRK